MTNGWTDERRKKQAAAIRQWAPWQASTGPKSVAGKKRASLNALKHGGRCPDIIETEKLLAINRAFVKQALVLAETLDHEKIARANELLAESNKNKEVEGKPPPPEKTN